MDRLQLEQLLTKDIPDLQGKNLWIWGTGDTSCLYQEGLSRTGLSNKILGYCDNDETKWGGTFYGKPIISPKELTTDKDIYVLVCSLQPKINEEIMGQLNAMKVEGHLIDEVILKLYYKDVLKCFDLLYDDKSRNDFVELVKSRLLGKHPDKSIISDNTYFAWRQFASKDVIGGNFIDCGAYIGDTLEKYIWYTEGIYNKITAIEPDNENYHAMKKRKKRLCEEWNLKEDSIQLINVGVSDKTADYQFVRSNRGLGSKFAENRNEGTPQETVALDDLITEPYAFLKADIESFEYKMLLGAKKGIQQYRPNLAICIYHNSIDFFSIALLIHSFVPEYKIAIRHHLNTLSETVLYAWIDD